MMSIIIIIIIFWIKMQNKRQELSWYKEEKRMKFLKILSGLA